MEEDWEGLVARVRLRAGGEKGEVEELGEEEDKKVVEQEMLTILQPSTQAMEPHHWTQATLLQTLKGLAVLRMTATQTRPQRIATAPLPWTLDTELLRQATKDPRLQPLLPTRSLSLITTTRRSLWQPILVQAPVPVSQTMLPPSLLIPLMLPVLPTVHHHLLRRRRTMKH